MPMNKVDLWKKAVSLRKQLGDDATSPIDIFTLAYSIDRLSIVYYPMGERLSGICVKDERSNVIAINSSMTLGRQRFSMAHELLPPDALSDMIKQIKKVPSDKLSIKHIVRIEQYFQTSRQAVLYRLVGEDELTLQEAESMRENVILSAVNLGYDDTLYKPTSVEKQYGTYGYYIQQVKKVMERGLISSGKYEELLLSAYRSDLVYGDEAGGGEVLD